MRAWLLTSLILVGCQVRPSNPTAVEELSCQVADAKQAQHVAQTELDILHEKINRQLKSQEKMSQEIKTLHQKLAQAEQEIASLEQTLATRVQELHSALKSVANLKRVYTVKKGDSLEKIAKREKTTISAIKKTNKLSSDRIYPGQKLTIQ